MSPVQIGHHVLPRGLEPGYVVGLQLQGVFVEEVEVLRVGKCNPIGIIGGIALRPEELRINVVGLAHEDVTPICERFRGGRPGDLTYVM